MNDPKAPAGRCLGNSSADVRFHKPLTGSSEAFVAMTPCRSDSAALMQVLMVPQDQGEYWLRLSLHPTQSVPTLSESWEMGRPAGVGGVRHRMLYFSYSLPQMFMLPWRQL